MLEAVKIRKPDAVFQLYPHQLSGGMGQRAMIAMMLVAEPDLLIADEPTSALDVTVQNEVLRILDDLVRNRGMGLIFISHNLNIVSSFCDRVLIMYGGTHPRADRGAATSAQAKHPYTRALLAAAPSLDAPARDTCHRDEGPRMAGMIEVQDLRRQLPQRRALGPCGAGRQLLGGRGRELRHRRRIGFGQVDGAEGHRRPRALAEQRA